MTVETPQKTENLVLSNVPDRFEIDFELLQGMWTEAQYLRITDTSRRLLEFTDGEIEVLPMPTDNHQVMLLFLYELFRGFIQSTGGKVLVAPLRLRIREGKHREPDLLLVRDARDPRRQNRFWLGADLVVEIVSADNPERDTVDKRADYAEAGIPEYWIVNPEEQTISVLRLADDAYVEHGVFRRGEQATSALLDGLGVDVSAVLDAE